MRYIAWIDGLGKPAWIALMVVSFIFIWPLGLAILGFLLWSGRMGCGGHGRGWEERRARFREARDEWRAMRHGARFSSGNLAFDEYRGDVLRKLREEQNEFLSFLTKLRRAKDQAEFNQFLAERGKPKGPGDLEPQT